uniref:VHS domain-containing protein n=1 Tax=Schistocephalus solidus TaxID=70667 RepID=A0A0V0JCN2_SCHSO
MQFFLCICICTAPVPYILQTFDLLILEAVTKEHFYQPDLAAFLEICDNIKQDPNGPEIALSALLEQLEQSAATYPESASLTLTLLDFCFKNCGYQFLFKLCRGDYLKKLKNLIEHGPYNLGIWNRLLTLIKVLGLAFSDHADFQPINALYQELLSQSIRFPNVQSTEVELLKRMIPPLGIPGALRLAQPAANTSQFLQGIRENLKYASLNRHAFDDLLQNLARSPSDSIKRTQLQVSSCYCGRSSCTWTHLGGQFLRSQGRCRHLTVAVITDLCGEKKLQQRILHSVTGFWISVHLTCTFYGCDHA